MIDLREDLPLRRRQMRGVPRDADRALRAYRNLPANPATTRPLALHVAVAAESRLERESEPEPQRTAVDATAHSSGSEARRRFLMGDLVVRRLKLRSVAKVSLAFFLCMLAMALVAGSVLWNLANRAGWVANWTGLLVDVGFTDATVDGASIFRASILAGLILVATATLLTVATAVIYNQISGLVGGFEVSLRSPRRTTRYGVRR